MSGNDSTTGWGSGTTQFFYTLTPERVLEAVEASGIQCTGRCLALGSFENRVYDVEIETEDGSRPRHPTQYQRVVKFYRPGRWSEAQILEEHEFLADLAKAEIPVIAPLEFPDGGTIRKTPEGIIYSIFPKRGGRSPDELDAEQLVRTGRLLARIHQIGAAKKAQHRIHLTPETYGTANLQYLLKNNVIPEEFRSRYERAVRGIVDHVTPWFKETKSQRVHGDCHRGNLLFGTEGAFFLDFDDMVVAPPVQDLWLILPSRERQKLELLLEGYEEIGDFDRSTLRLIEPLRALRFVHYTGWVARRWEDPAFPKAFPQFGSPRYWSDETEDLERQWRIILSGQAFGSETENEDEGAGNH